MTQQDRQYFEKYAPFERQAHRYEAWFDGEKGQCIFPLEARCLQNLTDNLTTPWLEVGVGTGRFAEALGIGYGIDPSGEALKYASGKGISVQRGFAEELPYATASFGAVFMIVTVCFLTDPNRAFHECARVLGVQGSLILGLVPKDSPWGRMYAEKGLEGHPFYSPAHFYTRTEAIDMVGGAGFELKESQSCLVEPPGTDLNELHPPHPGFIPEAGFMAMRFVRKD